MAGLFVGSFLSEDLLAAVLAAAHAYTMWNARRSTRFACLYRWAIFSGLPAPRRTLVARNGGAASSFLQCHGLSPSRVSCQFGGPISSLCAAREGEFAMGLAPVPISDRKNWRGSRSTTGASGCAGPPTGGPRAPHIDRETYSGPHRTWGIALDSRRDIMEQTGSRG